MRTRYLIAALLSAACLCACGRNTPVETSAVEKLTLPTSFVYDESAPVEHGELDIAGRFIVENRRGAPIEATLRLRDWGIGLEEIEGETVTVTLPARGRVSTELIGRRARSVSMRLEGAGMVSQSDHRFEFVGVRVVVGPDVDRLPVVAGELFDPPLEDQLPAAPAAVIDANAASSPGMFRFNDYFRVVNELGVSIPLELEFRDGKDEAAAAFSMAIVVPAQGVSTHHIDARYRFVTVITPVRPLHSDTLSKATVQTGEMSVPDGHVVEYRMTPGERHMIYCADVP